MNNKTIITCALTGVFTDPKTHAVPVTPSEMAQAALDAYNAGATIVHCHFRDQRPGKGHLPTWDPDTVEEICNAIRVKVPNIILNMSTGVLGSDISGPAACMERVKPEMAAMNSGSLNYLKIRKDGSWAWDPIVFDNPVDKVQNFLTVMKENQIIPECECFDTGILRSLSLFVKNGMLAPKPFVSLVMGIASGMPSKPEWIPLLKEELPESATWQVIAIGRQEVWPLLKKAIIEGGNIRTGVEDTFYLPDGTKTNSNGALVTAAANLVRELGYEPTTAEETKKRLQEIL